MSQGADILLGLQWGDEGKGKIVDVLTKQYDVVARFKGDLMLGIHLSLTTLNMFFIPYPQEYSIRMQIML